MDDINHYELSNGHSPFWNSWLRADKLHGGLGVKCNFDDKREDQDNEEAYTGAMLAHYREKGLIMN